MGRFPTAVETLEGDKERLAHDPPKIARVSPRAGVGRPLTDTFSLTRIPTAADQPSPISKTYEDFCSKRDHVR
jgi:hypothetical protein